MLGHLRKSESRMANLTLRPGRLTVAAAEACDEEARTLDRVVVKSGLRRGTAQKACAQVLGPRWPIVPLTDNMEGRRRGQRRFA